MMMPFVHSGCYLVCRTAVRAEVSAPIPALFRTLVEDLKGDVEHLSLFNFRSGRLANMNRDVMTSCLSPGTILVIKEPHLKLQSNQLDGKDFSFLSVESPSDVLVIHPTDHVLITKYGADQW